MPAAVQSTSAPRRPATSPKTSAEARPKKLPKAAVEATAEAFLVLFKSLPGAVKSRIVELIDDYEDELDEKQLAAERLANPKDFAPENAITLEEYVRQRRARAPKTGTSEALAA